MSDQDLHSYSTTSNNRGNDATRLRQPYLTADQKCVWHSHRYDWPARRYSVVGSSHDSSMLEPVFDIDLINGNGHGGAD
jgi:hypothetical protein